MESVENAILSRLERVVLAEDVVKDVIDAAMRRFAETRLSGRPLRARIERELRSAQRSVNSYVKAIGAGVDLAEVREARGAATQRRDALKAELTRAAEETESPSIDRRELRTRLGQWREQLRAAPEVARKILRLLLPEPLDVDRTAEGVRYRGRAAFAALLAGICQSAM